MKKYKHKSLTDEQFWERVDIRSDDECWNWIRSVNQYGYGDALHGGKRRNSSRVAWVITHGEPDDGLVVCHRCDNPRCCNPSHLFLGTQGDNVRDCKEKGRARGYFVAGDAHPRVNAKLDPEKVARARELYKSGVTQTKIGEMFGVHSSVISRAVRGESWGNVE